MLESHPLISRRMRTHLIGSLGRKRAHGDGVDLEGTTDTVDLEAAPLRVAHNLPMLDVGRVLSG